MLITVVFVGPRAEKFSTSDEHGYMRKFDFSVLDRKYPFWSNLVQKITIVSLNSHLVPRINSSMQNSMMSLIFFNFWLKILFQGKFGLKNHNCQFKLKFVTYTNSNMQNSIGIIFPVLSWKEPFQESLVEKIKIISISCHLVPEVIRICRSQWWCSLFVISTGMTLFGQIWSKKSTLSV